VSGSRCFGYEKDGVTVKPDEAEALRDAAKKIVQGVSLRSVTMLLNDAGHKTTTGKDWHASTLRRLITSHRISGRRDYRGRVTKGDWEPIITPELQDQVIQTLVERGTSVRRSTPRRYLLTGGLLVCGLCGNSLSSQPGKGRKRGYVCRQGAGLPGCGRIRIQADPIETEVIDRVIARLASPSIRRRIAAMFDIGDDFTSDRILEAITAEETRLSELGVDYADGRLDRIAFNAAAERLQDRIELLRQQAASAERLHSMPGMDADALLTWFEHAPLTAQRDLVSVVLDHVVVNPATRRGPVGLDDDRLDWVWRT